MTDNYKAAVIKSLEQNNVTVCVKDESEHYYDLEHSRNITEIVEACEATEAPIIDFYVNGQKQGSMVVLVGYGDESISNYHNNEFMNNIADEFI